MQLPDDLRLALRRLAKNPWSSLGLIMILAIGIGGATALFTLLDSAVLRPLPFKNPDRIMQIGGAGAPPAGDRLTWWQKRFHSFVQLEMFSSGGLNFSNGGAAERVDAACVSPGFFSLLGVGPAKGRDFAASDAMPNAPGVAIISRGFWAEEFGSDPGIVGKNIRLNGVLLQIVGVMPAGFDFPSQTKIWMPGASGTPSARLGGLGMQRMLGRLATGVTRQQADAEFRVLLEDMREEEMHATPGENFGEGAGMVVPLKYFLVRNYEKTLKLLFLATCSVLLICCANIASMLLVRLAARQQEIAVRFVLGADRVRILRQLLVESLLLAVLGATAGVLFAVAGVGVLQRMAPASVTANHSISLDWRVLLFALGITLATGIFTGIAPAFHGMRTDLNESLKRGGMTTAFGVRQFVRSSLVVLETALAVALLIGSVLMTRSFFRLSEVNPGFEVRHAAAIRILLPKAAYPAPNNEIVFQRQLLGTLKRDHRILAAGFVNSLPIASGQGGWYVFPAGQPESNGDFAFSSIVGGEYFRAIGIPFLSGRTFNSQDTAQSPKVVIVSQLAAKHFWGNHSPVGERLNILGYGLCEVVGVVGNVRSERLSAPAEDAIYTPYSQPESHDAGPFDMTLVVRTASDLEAIIPALRAAVASADTSHDAATFQPETLEDVVAGSAAPLRFRSLLLGIFSLVAVILAVLGVYGVVAYSAALRTHEIGVRMALGARPANILTLVMGQGLQLSLAGAALGAALALAAAEWLSSLLYGVVATNAATYLVSAILLCGVALLACLGPALRAARTHPMEALRYE